jgi:hypothetical protein
MKNASIGWPHAGIKLARRPHEYAILPGLLVAISCALVQGCAAVPYPTQIVEVPVHTPCVKEVSAVPAYEFDKLPLDAADGEKILALARDWVRGRRYEAALAASLAGCAT